MDPNKALDTIRENIAAYYATDDAEMVNDAAARVIEAIEGLDSWIVSDGFLPNSWDRS